MEIDLFLYWFSGVSFAIYMVGAVVFYHDRNMYGIPKRAYKVTSLLMLYLAGLTVRDVLLPYDSPLFMGHPLQMDVMVNLFTAPLTIFVVMELTHYRTITFLTYVRHLFPFVLTFVLFVQAVRSQFQYHEWIFSAYLIFTSAYVLYYIIVLKYSVSIYESKLQNTYANTEGRVLNWYFPLVGLMMVQLFLSTIVLIVFDSEAALIFSDVAALVFWGLISFRVRRMRESSLIPLQENAEEDIIDKIPVNQDDEFSSETTEESSDDNAAFMDSLNRVLTEGGLLCRDDLTREDVAKALGINHSAMIRILKSATGMTFSEFICELRLVKASHMLVETTDGVEQILYSCGFRSRTTFHRSFTKKYHCSPTDYRMGHNTLKKQPGDFEFN